MLLLFNHFVALFSRNTVIAFKFAFNLSFFINFGVFKSKTFGP